jgi:hypothetical protein
VTKNVLSRAPQHLGRHVKSLVPAAFAAVSNHKSALDLRGGLWPDLFMGLHIRKVSCGVRDKIKE